MYLYSVSRPTSGPYIFQTESTIRIQPTKCILYRLTDFLDKYRSEVILNCFNQGLIEPDKIRKHISTTFEETSKQLNIVSIS